MNPCWIALLSLVGAFPLFAEPKAGKQPQVALTFEPNRGQAGPGVQFVARGTGYYLTLESTGTRMILRQGGKSASVRTRFAGANAGVTLSGARKLPGHSAFFRGQDPSKWITGVANYAQVDAENLYPGIDVRYYGNQLQLEYDLIVHPGADPGQICLQIEGATGLHLDSEGNLIMATEAGELKQHKPVIYQAIAGIRHPVSGKFRIASRNRVGFAIDAYDRSQELTIDPVLVYSSFLGGRDGDEGHAVATDGAANTYLAGITFSTQFGDADVLVRKISADGTTFLYTADLGGSDNDYGNGLAVDVNGYAFVGGRTRSADFPVANAFQDRNYGTNNAFVLRLDSAANRLVFSTYIGGSNDDRGYALALDRQGSVYLTGIANSNDFPTNDGAFQRDRRGGTDAFVSKFAFEGTALYSTYLGGKSDEQANGIAVDADGKAYVVGDTFSDNFPQANAPFQHSRHGGLEGFVSEISADGSQLLFSTFIGGSGDDSCGAAAVDLSGNVYVVGSTTTDKEFSVPNRSYNTGFNGGESDIFVTKYTPNGQTLAWTTFLGSHGGDYGNAIAADSNGNVYIAGDTDSDQYPVTGDATQPKRAGNVDAVLSVMDTNGQNLLFSTFYGGRGNDSALGVAVDQYAQVYLTGLTDSVNLAIRQAVQPLPGGGESDAFLAKISVYGSAIPGSSPSSNPAPAAVANPVSATGSAFGPTMQVNREAGRFGPRSESSGLGVQSGAMENQVRRSKRSGRPVIHR